MTGSVPMAGFEKLLYTIDEAGKAIGMSRSTLFREIAAGKLLARKRGQRTYILASDLNAYLEALPVARENLA